MTEEAEKESLEQDEYVLTQWEFVGRVPTGEEVIALLKSLPPVWGIEMVEYADFVVGLPSSKKIVERDDRGRKIENYVDVVTLYMSVAGRVKMINAAAEKNGWWVEFEPEPVTPTGVPGYVQMDDRIVYREYVAITLMTTGATQLSDPMALGRKPGTAWVRSSGGQAAAGSNPYEKVETSARGRAIAAWGFGVLPGSGIASLEEMQGMAANRAGLGQEQEPEPTTRKSKATLIADVMTLAEEVRQERGIEQEAMYGRLEEYVKGAFGLSIATATQPDATGEESITQIDLGVLKPGQLGLVVNQLADTLKKLRSNAASV